MKRRLTIYAMFVFFAAFTILFTGCIKITRMPGTPQGSSSITEISQSPAIETIAPTQTADIDPQKDDEAFTQYIGNGQDTVTIMLYLCGSDLESSYGCATDDLNEILDANVGDNVNIVIETGGASYWQNTTISNQTNQRYLISSEGFFLLEDNMGQKDMTSPETLGDFISFCSSNYPANRNILILWDHGGGSVAGYGYDELFDKYNYDSMTLPELKYALELGGSKFEIIGFDACLMATVETGYVLKDYADFMLASQKMEPGSGWYYTGWINDISNNPSMPPEELSRSIIDDFIIHTAYESYVAEGTLALVDLNKMDKLYTQILEYFSAADQTITDGGFADVSRARAYASSGGRDLQADYDHVDIVSLARNLKNNESDELIAAVEEAIIYFNYCNTSDVNGLTIYFPYTDLSYFDSIVDMYRQIGMDDRYIDFLSGFISVMVGGQDTESYSVYSDPNDSYSAQEDWSEYEWYDDDLVSSYEDYYEQTAGYYYDLLLTEKGDNYVLSLTDDEWDIIVGIELQVYLDDGYGYRYLGSDNIYDFDDEGDLIISFDNSWVSVEGQTVAFYAEDEVITEEGFWYTYGASPAYLNDEPVDIIVMWDDNNSYGYIAGARYYYDSTISQKGYAPINDGDVLIFMFDYYDYDYEYDGSYYCFDPMTVAGEPVVSYEDIGYGDCLVYYMLTDIYGNQYWTEQVLFYD